MVALGGMEQTVSWRTQSQPQSEVGIDHPDCRGWTAAMGRDAGNVSSARYVVTSRPLSVEKVAHARQGWSAFSRPDHHTPGRNNPVRRHGISRNNKPASSCSPLSTAACLNWPSVHSCHPYRSVLSLLHHPRLSFAAASLPPPRILSPVLSAASLHLDYYRLTHSMGICSSCLGGRRPSESDVSDTQ